MASDLNSLTKSDAPASSRVTVALVVAVLLLVASVVLGLQAAWARWAVCFVDVAPPVPGMPSEGACMALQDHRYDYSLPSDPWVPIGDAAQRDGLSLLALGFAVALVSMTLADHWVVRVLGTATAFPWLVVGVTALRSGLAGEPVVSVLQPWLGPMFVLAPLVAFCLAVPAVVRDGGSGALFWLAMTVAHPLPEFFITLPLWTSHDSSPLTGFFRCAAVAVAAVAVAMTLLSRRRRPMVI